MDIHKVEPDPDILTMATAALDGELSVFVDVLAIHGVWAKRYEGGGG